MKYCFFVGFFILHCSFFILHSLFFIPEGSSLTLPVSVAVSAQKKAPRGCRGAWLVQSALPAAIAVAIAYADTDAHGRRVNHVVRLALDDDGAARASAALHHVDDAIADALRFQVG